MLPESEIGQNIRSIRESRKLTLEELAQKTGFTKGYLSKVENSDKAPPVSTMIRIAEAFGVGISVLFGEEQEVVPYTLVRKYERPAMARDGSRFGYSYETLAHNFPHKHMDPYILTIPRDAEQTALFEHKGEEMLMVLEGRLRCILGDMELFLEEGDTIYFDSGIPHRGFAVNCEQAVCLMVVFRS